MQRPLWRGAILHLRWAATSLAVVAGLGTGARDAEAQIVGATCVVSDPNEPTLNLRDAPRGKKLAVLSNGTEVTINDVRDDDRGLPWARVRGGWVNAKFLKCADAATSSRSAQADGRPIPSGGVSVHYKSKTLAQYRCMSNLTSNLDAMRRYRAQCTVSSDDVTCSYGVWLGEGSAHTIADSVFFCLKVCRDEENGCGYKSIRFENYQKGYFLSAYTSDVGSLPSMSADLRTDDGKRIFCTGSTSSRSQRRVNENGFWETWRRIGGSVGCGFID